jgi:hypothetical protein
MDSIYGAPYQSDLETYLTALDRALPAEAIAGVYLTGSAALGDYQHGRSDLDILTLTTRVLSEEELSALEELHKTLESGRQPHVDAVYVTREHLGQLPPENADGHGFVVDGEFKRGVNSQDLVSWATLHQCGITVRGPEAKSLDAAPEPREFRAWTRGNLDGYWRMRALQVQLAISAHGRDEEFLASFAVWLATGPGRLHRTIATGEIISKARSADYTADVFPKHAKLLKRVKASRLGDASVKFTMKDGRVLSDLVEEVCDAAKKLA